IVNRGLPKSSDDKSQMGSEAIDTILQDVTQCRRRESLKGQSTSGYDSGMKGYCRNCNALHVFWQGWEPSEPGIFDVRCVQSLFKDRFPAAEPQELNPDRCSTRLVSDLCSVVHDGVERQNLWIRSPGLQIV
ncbi:MAG: hypothetical protein ACK58L_01440, partial [Planctomycetota bacterium]